MMYGESFRRQEPVCADHNSKIWCRDRAEHINRNICIERQARMSGDCFWCGYYESGSSDVSVVAQLSGDA
jgi:hypothetical protein